MTRILVVDDSEVDRRIAAGLLQRAQAEYQIELAGNGREAITQLRESPPDLVVTDMQMPERDGLELVRAIRLHYPQVPVILMTAHGSDDLAILALEEGAASYVPKSQLQDRLAETVDEVLAIARADRTYERLIGCLGRTELDFQLDNDPALIDPLVDLVQQMAAGMRLCDANDRFRIGVALKAALLNALYRGNLEITADQMPSAREALLAGPLLELVTQRRQAAPYRDRTIGVAVRITPEEAQFRVRDGGHGFPVDATLATIPSAALDPHAGRGLVLMRAFMDEVTFNERGNEVLLRKKHSPQR
ncbi:MAG: response regulator [Pirellulales bacterium]